MNITLVLTHDCNLRCRYCYAGMKWRQPMSWEAANRAVDLAFGEPSPWMDRALVRGIRRETVTVVDPANVRWLARSVAFLADRGVPKTMVNPNFLAIWPPTAA